MGFNNWDVVSQSDIGATWGSLKISEAQQAKVKVKNVYFSEKSNLFGGNFSFSKHVFIAQINVIAILKSNKSPSFKYELRKKANF